MVRLHSPPSKCSEQIRICVPFGNHGRGCPSNLVLFTAVIHFALCSGSRVGWECEEFDPMARSLGTVVCAAHNATGARHAFLVLPIVPKISEILHAFNDLVFAVS